MLISVWNPSLALSLYLCLKYTFLSILPYIFAKVYIFLNKICNIVIFYMVFTDELKGEKIHTIKTAILQICAQ